MKKLFVMGLVMIMVLAITGIGAANYIAGLPVDNDLEEIPVTATVYPYVEFRGTADTLAFSQFENIKLKGNEGAADAPEYTADWQRWRSNDLLFYIASNFEVDFNMEVTEALNNGSYTLPTKLVLFDNPFNWMGETDSSKTFSGIQGMALHQYRLRVAATLNDVHEQPEGDYSGLVTLTVGASSTI